MREEPAAAPETSAWSAVLDGRPVERAVAPTATLAEAIRDTCHDAGEVPPVKVSCGEGSCGACSVLVDGRRALACLQPAWRFAGCRIDTAARFAETDIPRALAAAGALQCGFCTPGMVVALADLRARGVRPANEAELAGLLDANLCRCTGYQQLLEAGVQLLRGSA